MAASPSARVYRRLHDLRPKHDAVLRFAVYTESVQRAQDVFPGKELGKDLGKWTEYRCRCDQVRRYCNRCCLDADLSFRSSVQSFPEPLFGISVAVDGHIFQTDVCSASHPPTQSPRPPQAIEIRRVVLVGIRLGIAEVNPIYNETIKVCLIDINEGAVHIPTISWNGGRASFVIILPRCF
jgi:hypothetical protein